MTKDVRVNQYIQTESSISYEKGKCMDSRILGWLSVAKTLSAVCPDWVHEPGNGVEAAVAAILKLKDQADELERLKATLIAAGIRDVATMSIS